MKQKTVYMVMDKGYEDDITREAVKRRGFRPIVPPKSNRKKPWRYNKEIYRCRNEVERLFRRIKGFGRVCTLYDKLDTMYLTFSNLALIYDELKLCKHAVIGHPAGAVAVFFRARELLSLNNGDPQ